MGCGLNLHLKDGVAVNLTHSTDYPVNLGIARTNDRGTTYYTYDDDGRTMQIDSPEGIINYEYDDLTGNRTHVTTGVFDPNSKQPSYKTCAVTVHLDGRLS